MPTAACIDCHGLGAIWRRHRASHSSSPVCAQCVHACMHAARTQESLVSPIDRRSDFYRHAALVAPHSRDRQPLMTIPNVLTFFRLLLVPVLLALWETGMRYGARAAWWKGSAVSCCVRGDECPMHALAVIPTAHACRPPTQHVVSGDTKTCASTNRCSLCACCSCGGPAGTRRSSARLSSLRHLSPITLTDTWPGR